MHLLPDSEKLDGIPVPQPIRDKEIAIFGPEHIRQRNEIHVSIRIDRDLCTFYTYFRVLFYNISMHPAS